MLIIAVSIFFYANFHTASFPNLFLWLLHLVMGYVIMLLEIVVRRCGYYVVS